MSSFQVSSRIVHISIGSDCAVAHQLRQLKLVESAFPFDWVKCDNPKMISDCLENSFSNFFCDYTLKEQSGNFDRFYESELGMNIKSRVKVILKNKMQFPHEANGTDFDFEEFKKKYSRRIERFNKIVKSPDYKKVFIRADNKKLSESDKEKLQDSLEKYVLNFEIKYITYDDYPVSGEFTWQRSYIDWEKIL